MKEKSVTFCFLKLKPKEKPNFFKIIGRGWLFCGKFWSLLSKLMFTHSDSCWKWTYELPHELRNNLGLTILRNEELLRLLTWVFIDLMIRGLELVTRGFELVNCGLELVTRGFELLTRGFELALLNFNSCF